MISCNFHEKRIRNIGMARNLNIQLSPRNSEVNALEQRGIVIGKKIGQGTYASVYLAELIDGRNLKRMRLACKIFDIEKAPLDIRYKFFPRELEILTKVENPHIIQIHSILQRGPRVFIFMRYADNGDLLDFLKKYGAIPEEQSKLWFRQMISGLHYLHGKNIAHRDLKCENILLSRRFNVKLADFGFARFCTNEQGRRVLSHTYCGSAIYAAPEVVSGTPYNPKLADVWSLGVILFIMLNAKMPFDDKNVRTLYINQITKNWMFRTKIRKIISKSVKDIISDILEPDITLRLTLDRVLAHEWLRPKKEKSDVIFGRLVHSAPPIHLQIKYDAGHTREDVDTLSRVDTANIPSHKEHFHHEPTNQNIMTDYGDGNLHSRLINHEMKMLNCLTVS